MLIIDGDAACKGGDLFNVLERAETPHLDRLGETGRVGALAATPGTKPGHISAGHGLLTLLGYDASMVSGVTTAVFAAAAKGLGVGEADWAMRVALVSVPPDDDEGLMLADAGASREEIDALFDDLIAHWRETLPEHTERLTFRGTGAERLVIDRAAPTYANVETTPPGAVEGHPWIEHLPDGGDPIASERLCTLISASRHFLADHPVNAARSEQGLTPVNLAWIWGAGSPAGLTPFIDHVPHSAALLAELDNIVGAGSLIGLEAETVGEVDSLAGRIAGMNSELVIAAVSEPIERVDREIVGPLVAALGDREENPWRLLVSLSHDPAGGFTPFVLAGSWVRSVVPRRLCDGVTSDLRVDPGCELLEYVLRAGLRGRA